MGALFNFAFAAAAIAALLNAGVASAQSQSKKDPYETAMALMQVKNYKSALKYLDLCLKKYPDHPNVLVERGNAYLRMNEAKRAYDDFTKAISIKPRLARAYMLRASALVELGQTDEAIADLNKSLKLKPHFQAYSLRGRLLAQSGKFKQGLPDLNESIRLRPTSGAYYDRGNEYFRVKQYDKAIADFTEAIKIPPKTELESAIVKHAYANRAESYEKLGKKDLAKKDRDMLTTDDGHTNLLLELAK